MKIKATKLIADLVERTRQNLNEAENLKKHSAQALHRKPAEDQWNALECVEHLNIYGDFYLEEMESAINRSNYPTEAYFKSGLLANYFAKSMQPGEDMWKVNTFKDMDPRGSVLDKSSIQQFTEDQQQLLALLDKSQSVSLNKTKVPFSLSRWIKIKLGDIFRIVIYHNQRHLVQAQKTLDS